MSAFQYPEIYRDTLDGLQISVSVLDLQKKIVFWSDGAEQITGDARIDGLGHTCAENILLHCTQSTCEMCTGKAPWRQPCTMLNRWKGSALFTLHLDRQSHTV
jgi:PAS domain-containing protein